MRGITPDEFLKRFTPKCKVTVRLYNESSTISGTVIRRPGSQNDSEFLFLNGKGRGGHAMPDGTTGWIFRAIPGHPQMGADITILSMDDSDIPKNKIHKTTYTEYGPGTPVFLNSNPMLAKESSYAIVEDTYLESTTKKAKLFMETSHMDCCGIRLLYNFQHGTSELYDSMTTKELSKIYKTLRSNNKATRVIFLAETQTSAIHLVKRLGGTEAFKFKNPNSSNYVSCFNIDFKKDFNEENSESLFKKGVKKIKQGIPVPW